MEGHCESLLAQLLCSQIPPSASGSLRCDFYLRQSSKIKYLIQGSEKATWISLRCGQKVLPQCNQRKPFIVLEHIDPVALAAALRKGLFSKSYDNLPFTLSACRSLKTFGQFLCRKMRDFILHGVEASLVGESLTRRSSGPHFLQFCTAPYSSGTGKDSSLWHPSGAGALKEGDLGLTGAGRGHEGLGARTSARGSPLLLGDLPHYVQICRRGEPKALFCFAKGVDIWHNPGNNWLQSCPFLGFPA